VERGQVLIGIRNWGLKYVKWGDLDDRTIGYGGEFVDCFVETLIEMGRLLRLVG